MSLKRKIKREMTKLDYLKDFLELLGISNVSFQVFDDEDDPQKREVWIEFESRTTLKQVLKVLSFFVVEPEDIEFISSTSSKTFYVSVDIGV